MDRFAVEAGRQFRIRAVVGIGILLLIRKGPEYVGKPPTRGLPVGLLPYKDTAVLLNDGPNPKALRLVGTIFVGDVPVGSVGSPTPPVEGTLNAITLDLPAVANVRA
jgi:hypothetical protein